MTSKQKTLLGLVVCLPKKKTKSNFSQSSTKSISKLLQKSLNLLENRKFQLFDLKTPLAEIVVNNILLIIYN